MRESKSLDPGSNRRGNYGGLSIGMTPSPPSVIINEVEMARQARRRKKWWCGQLSSNSALGGFIFLVGLAAAGERIAFKVAIDQMEPFRVFLALFVNLSLVLVSGVVVLYKKMKQPSEITPSMHRFPRWSIFLIALLDTLSLVVMVVAGASTPPVLTVLFMQATIPFIILLSSCPPPSFSSSPFSPSITTGRGGGRKTKMFKNEHWQGGGLILLGIAVAMAPTVHAAFWHGHRDIGINTLAYVLCCLPAAFSQLVKERAIIKFSQPMNFYYLNLLLGIYQFVLLLVLSPLTYRLQGLGMGWNTYAMTDLSTAVTDMCLCLFSGQSIPPGRYPIDPQCRFASLATFFYIFSTLLVTFAVNGVLAYGTPLILYRTINASVALAFVVLALYSMNKWAWITSYALNIFDFLGLFIVLAGMERYHREPEPDTEMLTHFSLSPEEGEEGEEEEVF